MDPMIKDLILASAVKSATTFTVYASMGILTYFGYKFVENMNTRKKSVL